MEGKEKVFCPAVGQNKLDTNNKQIKKSLLNANYLYKGRPIGMWGARYLQQHVVAEQARLVLLRLRAQAGDAVVAERLRVLVQLARALGGRAPLSRRRRCGRARRGARSLQYDGEL